MSAVHADKMITFKRGVAAMALLVIGLLIIVGPTVARKISLTHDTPHVITDPYHPHP